jgi:hypothetical protein
MHKRSGLSPSVAAESIDGVPHADDATMTTTTVKSDRMSLAAGTPAGSVASPFRPASYPAVPLAPRRVAGTFIAIQKYSKHRLRRPRCNSVESPRPALATTTIARTTTTRGRTRRPTPQQPRPTQTTTTNGQERIIVLNNYANKTYMREKLAWPCRRAISGFTSPNNELHSSLKRRCVEPRREEIYSRKGMPSLDSSTTAPASACDKRKYVKLVPSNACRRPAISGNAAVRRDKNGASGAGCFPAAKTQIYPVPTGLTQVVPLPVAPPRPYIPWPVRQTQVYPGRPNEPALWMD